MDDDYLVERTDFPFYAVEWVTEGHGCLSMSSREFDLSVGSMFAYGPGIAHRIRNVAPDNMRKYYLDIAGKDAAKLLKRLGLLNQQPVKVSRCYEFVELWNMIDREARDVGTHSAEICESLTHVFIQKIEQRMIDISAGDSSDALKTFEDACVLMESRFLDFRSIEEIAAEMGISPVYLSRLFKRFAGSGAYRHLLRLRMNYAAELLLERKLKIRVVAERLQYADAFQFSRAFKRIYGVPPSEVSKSLSNNSP
jgi:AraC-like DNA-binding protein